MRRRKLAGPQPVSKLPGELTDPYQREPEQTPERIFATLITPEQDMRPARFPQTRDGRPASAGCRGDGGDEVWPRRRPRSP